MPAKTTPGTWRWDTDMYLSAQGVILDANGLPVCRVARTNQERNARLICAAPALVTALREVDAAMRLGEFPSSETAAMLDALNRAVPNVRAALRAAGEPEAAKKEDAHVS